MIFEYKELHPENRPKIKIHNNGSDNQNTTSNQPKIKGMDIGTKPISTQLC